ncbi:hypothetical protein P9Y11_22970 [Bacillus cereus]|nr:hypothetical protein [Bacillus cereus]
MSTEHLTLLEFVGLCVGIVLIYGLAALVGYGSSVLIDKLISRKGRR